MQSKNRYAIVTLTIIGFVSGPRAHVVAGPYAPAAGQPGSDAVPKDSPAIRAWADSVAGIARGPINISDPSSPVASFGDPSSALGAAQGTPFDVVSLGDGGQITLRFSQPIFDGPDFDLAVFENSFSDSFLELALVEVSTNGVDFARFPAASLTQTQTQVGSFGSLDASDLYDLAGKYRGGFGTPFDLAELAGSSPLVDIHQIQYVRVIDVVGSIDPGYARHDAQSRAINDPWPTFGATSGFDLDGVAALHVVPEPGALLLAVFPAVMFMLMLRRRGMERRGVRMERVLQ
jgi:hypothetical protein